MKFVVAFLLFTTPFSYAESASRASEVLATEMAATIMMKNFKPAPPVVTRLISSERIVDEGRVVEKIKLNCHTIDNTGQVTSADFIYLVTIQNGMLWSIETLR